MIGREAIEANRPAVATSCFGERDMHRRPDDSGHPAFAAGLFGVASSGLPAPAADPRPECEPGFGVRAPA